MTIFPFVTPLKFGLYIFVADLICTRFMLPDLPDMLPLALKTTVLNHQIFDQIFIDSSNNLKPCCIRPVKFLSSLSFHRFRSLPIFGTWVSSPSKYKSKTLRMSSSIGLVPRYDKKLAILNKINRSTFIIRCSKLFIWRLNWINLWFICFFS